MFIILMLIFVLQTVWLYIKELAGKDLDLIVIFKFLAYFMPKLIPLVLPLTILLASIMVFGSFAENYEFAAMKSTGISLQRAMSGLSIFIVILGIVTFFFSNNVIPWAELNSYNLRRNIAKIKPSMGIAEGQFNEIESTPYNIKVEKKSGDRGQFLEDVTIHVKGSNGRTNSSVIKSKTGELASEEDSNVLKLILLDGYYYSDMAAKKPAEKNKKPFVKSYFEKKIINIDLSELNSVDFDEQSQTDKYNMLDVVDLNKTIDSLVVKSKDDHESFSKNLFQRSGVSIYRPKKQAKDSVYLGPILDVFNTKQKLQVVDAAIKAFTSSKQILTSKEETTKLSKAWLNRHIISLHEKFALGFACVILFFVGAPLGALIRKGGIGLPMVIAIVLFLTYHFIGIFATNSAKGDGINPILASWFSTLVMLPLGIFLTKRATEDRGLFETDGLLEPLKKLFRIKKKALLEDYSSFPKSSEEYRRLNKNENNTLIDIVRNYNQYEYSLKYRNTALAVLDSRGITKQQLKFAGHFKNQKYEDSLRLKNTFEEDSNLALVLYIFMTLLILVGSILKNNKFPVTGNILFILGILIGIIFLFAISKSFLSFASYNKHIDNESKYSGLIFLLVGLPLYFIVYVYTKKKFNQDLNIREHNKG
ncbi:LptF/LptG family permease [Tamlana fucoidanivorans]|uniref:LptF/LptG family permease n=1 Tax=Allotamlana fucoidanivorans TaxID=2583814 RepID=UPI0026D8F30A